MNARSAIKEQIQRVREEAIVTAVNRLLATKGYDAMTVDEVAAEAGMAKASLYKLFTSKEELAGAAMVGVLDRALGFVDDLRNAAQAAAEAGQPIAALEQLKAVVRWAMRTQLEGQMPSLPAQNSNLSASLQSNDAYMDRLIALSNRLSIWITEAQTRGQLPAALPAELVLYTLFARACDPVLGLLKDSGQYSDDQIIDWVTGTTFHGLAGPAAAPGAAPSA
ncbi:MULTISPECIES: TetR/AcrR family transcriptional regulator [Comamonas]|jgi:TetR/AcrR family transcriptional regulator of autoinduction and epiphytic fitness|uniref:TetR/AcrR family transcriptional regulator n=1 Tax=Comamonas squillarum TaxID=2977320 RepID=A0ABY5ZV80_9BURK|nr:MULTISPECIES: helix-turn-helix domain-containing protein [Comamonas]UXC17890.1 TetR/AcrR family transcriptional regulator [Comamonas sp. PR12]